MQTSSMNLEATGYENIVLRGVFLGLPVKEVRRMIPDIEAFTELGEFLTLPLRTYSTGMIRRPPLLERRCPCACLPSSRI